MNYERCKQLAQADKDKREKLTNIILRLLETEKRFVSIVTDDYDTGVIKTAISNISTLATALYRLHNGSDINETAATIGYHWSEYLQAWV